VTVSETSSVLAPLLTLLYPVSPYETLAQLSQLELSALVPFFDASCKYLFVTATHHLSSILHRPNYLQKFPLEIYALSCRFDIEDLKCKAAEACLRINLMEFEFPKREEDSQSKLLLLNQMTAFEYHKLLSWQFLRSRLAQHLIKRRSLRIDPLLAPAGLPASLADDTYAKLAPPCPQCSATAHFGPALPPKWWITFEKLAVEELRKKPGCAEEMFDLSGEFMRRVVKESGCVRCGTSLMIEAATWMAELKKELKQLEVVTIVSPPPISE
jgi:hypothetical protein